MFDLRRLLRWLVAAALLGAVVATVLVVIGDAGAVADSLSHLRPLTVILMLALAFVGFVLRALRWGHLMRLFGHTVSLGDALYLHISGQTMGITPGHVGEVLKPVLSREVAGLRMSRGVPLMFAERVADLIAVILLTLGGLSAIGGATWIVVTGLVVVAAGTAVASSAWFQRLALRVLGAKSWSARKRDSAEIISETIRRSLDWRMLLWSVPVSVIAWGLEGVGFALCLRDLGMTGLSLPSAISVYGLATIAGAFSFVPGGIGFTEASMTGVLIALGMPAAASSAATIITRATTLWWSVLVGWVFLSSRPRLLKSLLGKQDSVG